jgi:serine/threonine protein phosphatase 1
MVSLRSSSDILGRPGRTIAIGDIHGCASALRGLLAEIQPTSGDTLVTLGDYVDRGPDSRGVLDALIELKHHCRLVPLLGNHEQMLFSARASQMMCKHWLRFGGEATLRSFGPLGLKALTPAHLTFLESCHMHFETPTHLFVHANYNPTKPIDQQDEDTALSLSLHESLPGPHVSGKTVIVGHTAQESGEILDLGYLKCLDTNCCEGGYLTALDVNSGQIWRTREVGLQRCSLRQIAQHLAVTPPGETSPRQDH